jgi:hypothetical protein
LPHVANRHHQNLGRLLLPLERYALRRLLEAEPQEAAITSTSDSEMREVEVVEEQGEDQSIEMVEPMSLFFKRRPNRGILKELLTNERMRLLAPPEPDMDEPYIPTLDNNVLHMVVLRRQRKARARKRSAPPEATQDDAEEESEERAEQEESGEEGNEARQVVVREKKQRRVRDEDADSYEEEYAEDDEEYGVASRRRREQAQQQQQQAQRRKREQQ